MISLREYADLMIFFAPSLTAASAVGIAGGVVGVFVLLRREGLVALSIPHLLAVGAALALRNGWPTLPPAVVAAATAMALLAWSKRHNANSWVLPSLYVGGLCLSFLIIANSGQHLSDLQNLFTGLDVAVEPGQGVFTALTLLAVAAVTAALWRRWLLMAQATAVAEVAGLLPGWWDVLFLCLLSSVLLLGTDALGAVMVLSMLFLPAATVLPWARRVPTALLGAVLLSQAFLAIGFVLSNENEWPLSQSVGGVGFGALVVSNLAATVYRHIPHAARVRWIEGGLSNLRAAVRRPPV